MPIKFYKTKKGKTFYPTGNKFAELLRKAIWKVRPDTTSGDIKKYSAHLLCVWACILLEEARMSPKYIKKRLHWLGNSAIIQNQHLNTLQAASGKVMGLIPALPEDIIALSSMADGSDDHDMHEYRDDMD
jgi:hypothetical protein